MVGGFHPLLGTGKSSDMGGSVVHLGKEQDLRWDQWGKWRFIKSVRTEGGREFPQDPGTSRPDPGPHQA